MLKDRIGPDRLFAHLILHNKLLGRYYCKKKFKYFGNNSQIRPGSYIIGMSNISIGDNVVIRPGSVICAENDKGATIKIENNVLLGSGVHIYINNHKYDNSKKQVNNELYDIDSVNLKNGCWIGANSIILSGVTVSEGAIVGAGSVVTNDVPPSTVVAGMPAKIIKRNK